MRVDDSSIDSCVWTGTRVGMLGSSSIDDETSLEVNSMLSGDKIGESSLGDEVKSTIDGVLLKITSTDESGTVDCESGRLSMASVGDGRVDVVRLMISRDSTIYES